MIYCRPKWSLGLPCTWNKCKCYWFDLLFSIGSAHTCLLHLLNESGHFLSRLGSHRERLLLLFLRGGRMAWETSIRTCKFFIPCWFEALSVNADCKLFPFCDFLVAAPGTGLHFQFLRCLSTCVSMLHKKPLPCLVIVANRRSAWAAKHVKRCRKMGWSGLRGLSVFPFLNFVQDQLDLKHSCLLWV